MLQHSLKKKELDVETTKKSLYLAHIRVELDLAKLKLLIVFLILVFFGLTTVFSQKYVNQILQATGVRLKNSIKTTMLSFVTKYISNLNLFVLMIIVLGMGTFASELEGNKQVYFTLARPISRVNYYVTRSLILTIGTGIMTFIGSLLVYLYATMYFKPLALEKIVLTFLFISLLYSSMYAIMILLSTKYTQMTAGVLGFLIFLVETVIAVLSSSYDPLKWFSILALSDQWLKIYRGTITPLDVTTEVIALVLWTVIPLLLGLVIYSKRDL